jgi:hypothetical protein
MKLLALLHEHHRVEAALMKYINDGMTREQFDQSALRKLHDQLEGDILYVMAPMPEAELIAVLDRYDSEGGYL